MTQINKLLSRNGVRPFLTRPIVIDWLQWSQEFAEEQDDKPYMPQVTLSLLAEYAAHVAKLEDALKVAIEALKDCENEWCKHPDIRLQANKDLSRDFCGQCHCWVYRNEIATPTRALAEIERIAGGGE